MQWGRYAGLLGTWLGICSRKTGATIAAENGATVHELNAMFGWTGTKMAMRYTENANRKRAAREGFKKLANNLATSIPVPDDKVRALAEK